MRFALPLLTITAIALSSCKGPPEAAAHPPEAYGQTTTTSDAKPSKVTTASVTRKEAPSWLLLTGQLKGAHETDLAANTAGRIIATKVERGSTVKVGDPIAIVDMRAAALSAAEATAQAANARTQAAAAKLDCERAKSLGASGAISKAETDRLDAQCRSSDHVVSAMDARSRLAAQNVGDGVIRAPFAGTVAVRNVDVGAYVHADTKVVTLVGLERLRLEIAIPETRIASAKAGTRVRFTVAGYADRSFDGTLRYVAGSVRQATRDIVAEADVDDPDGLLRSGMFASVQLAQAPTELPAIPRSSLVQRDGKPAAFVVAGGRVEQRFIQPGDELAGGLLAVHRGVREGESVVVAPAETLSNGQAVE